MPHKIGRGIPGFQNLGFADMNNLHPDKHSKIILYYLGFKHMHTNDRLSHFGGGMYYGSIDLRITTSTTFDFCQFW